MKKSYCHRYDIICKVGPKALVSLQINESIAIIIHSPSPMKLKEQHDIRNNFPHTGSLNTTFNY